MKLTPEELETRKPIWDAMQMVWMDTDIETEIEKIVTVCAKSDFALSELEAIYWDEVSPIVKSNMLVPVAPEWAGYDIDWLSGKIIDRLNNQKPSKRRWLSNYSERNWRKIEAAVLEARGLS